MTQQDPIASYQAELDAEAELARHHHPEHDGKLRSLVDELRATGAAAAARLAKPQLRTPFGIPLSRPRAWGAAALFVLAIVLSFTAYDRTVNGYLLLDVAIDGALVIGLLTRRTWARAAIAGLVGWNLIELGIWAVTYDQLWITPIDGAILGIEGAILALTMPWRRGEISLAGYALVLVTVMYSGAIAASWALITATPFDPLLGDVARLAAVLAAVGIVMRARWAAAFATLSGVIVVIAATGLGIDIGHPFPQMLSIVMIVAAVAAVACTTISWKTARSWRGSLRGFAS